MKTVNRGFIFVRPLQAFCDWAKQHDEDFSFNEEDNLEGTMYLIEEDFLEIEPLIEANFKKIFHNECLAVVEDENIIPKATMELFASWFSLEIGGMVFDLKKTDLIAEE